MQRAMHMMEVSVVVSHNPLMMGSHTACITSNIRLHSTSINCYAQRPSLIEYFRNQTAYVSILTDVWGFIILLMGKKTEVLTTSCTRTYSTYRQRWLTILNLYQILWIISVFHITPNRFPSIQNNVFIASFAVRF